MAVTGEQPHALTLALNDQAVAVVLDLVNPSGPDGGRATFDSWHGSMKPEGRRTITYGIYIGTILSHRQTPNSTVR